MRPAVQADRAAGFIMDQINQRPQIQTIRASPCQVSLHDLGHVSDSLRRRPRIPCRCFSQLVAVYLIGCKHVPDNCGHMVQAIGDPRLAASEHLAGEAHYGFDLGGG